MTNFIRGGQITMHNIRMAMQVIIILYCVGLLIFITSAILDFYSKTTSYERITTIQYYRALLACYLDESPKLMRWQETSGKYISVDPKIIINNSNVINFKNKINILLKESMLNAIWYTISGIILLIILFLQRGKNLVQPKYLRGGKLTSTKNLQLLIKNHNKKRNYKAYNIAGIDYPAFAENAHTLITGGSGTGKTTLICDLIEQIKERKDRAIIYDKMGTYISTFYDSSQDIILNPLDKRSPSWSLFDESRNIADCKNIAAALLPKSKSGVDPFWIESARIIFIEIYNIVKAIGKTSNEDFIKYLLYSDITELAQLLKATPARAILDERSVKTALSIMSVLSSNLQSMRFLHDDDNYFSIRKWIENEKQQGMLFISSRADQHETLKPLISAWLEIAINSLLSLEQSRTRKIWIILDELPSLHYLPSLQSGLAQTRQFGGAFVLSLQLMAQLREVYGKDNAEATSGLCRNRVIFSTPDDDTAKWCSDNLGKVELEELREGQSYGAHESRDGVNVQKNKHINNLVLSSEITNLPNLSAYIKLANDFPISLVKLEYQQRMKVAEKFILRTDLFNDFSTSIKPKATAEVAPAIDLTKII